MRDNNFFSYLDHHCFSSDFQVIFYFEDQNIKRHV